MLTVHHLNHSRSQRVLWLLEELGLEYDIVRYERDPKTLRAPPSLKAVHPLGHAPVITDEGRALAESGAILEIILGRYGNGRLVPPPGTPEHERYTYFMHYAEGSATLPLILRLIFTQMPTQPMPMLVRPVVRALAKNVIDTFIQPDIDTHLDYIEAALAKSLWFAGEEFSAADIQMSFPIDVAVSDANLNNARRPKLRAFLERIHARPAYRRAIDKGGPYDLTKLG
jgi:glutathione S-transferase